MDWLRWHHGTATDAKWRVVAVESGQPLPVVLAVWALMLETASQNEPRGTLAGWRDRVAAAALDIDPGVVTAVREAMQGLVLEGERLTGWERRQPKRERVDPNATERKRRQRERGRDVPPSRQVTPGHAESRTDKRRGEEIRREEKEPPSGEGAGAPSSAGAADAPPLVPGGTWMWDAWQAEFGSDLPGLSYTKTRREKLTALFHEQLRGVDDPRAELARILRGIRGHRFWGDKPNTWKPESCFRNAERREELAVGAPADAPRSQGGDDWYDPHQDGGLT